MGALIECRETFNQRAAQTGRYVKCILKVSKYKSGGKEKMHHKKIRYIRGLKSFREYSKYKLGIKVVTEMLRFPQPSKVQEKGKNP